MELRELQLEELKILKEALKIIKKHNLRYYMLGGTFLGAVRHKGFIPWDDDVDISMTRENYNKFKKIIELKKYKYLVLYEDILWCSRLVYIADTSPVFMDILIYDYITDNSFGSILKIFLLRVLQGMIKSRENLTFKGRNVFYCFSIFATCILGAFFPLTKKLDWYHELSENRLLGCKTSIHRSNDTFYGIAHIFDRGFMEEYKDIAFEKHVFMVNKRYKEFLVRSYGDNYMTPPPENERRHQHEGHRKTIEKRLDSQGDTF